MSRFSLIASGVDVSGINAELERQPELWNAKTYRTEQADSPHHGINDIWLRWRDPAQLVSHADYMDEHYPVFWPAWHCLPSLHQVVRNLSHVVNATALGGILLTETPAGGAVREHVDNGWHATFFNTKLYLTLKGDPRCLVHCDGEVQNFRAGDVWTYPNNVPHSVQNNGIGPHQNAIICYRTES